MMMVAMIVQYYANTRREEIGMWDVVPRPMMAMVD